jgi:hypothetical protein
VKFIERLITISEIRRSLWTEREYPKIDRQSLRDAVREFRLCRRFRVTSNSGEAANEGVFHFIVLYKVVNDLLLFLVCDLKSS